MEAKEKVLEVMRTEGRPLTAGEVAELSGLERKVVDKTFNQLKRRQD